MVIVEKEAQGGGRAATRYARSVAQYLQSASRLAIGEEYGITLAAYLPGKKAQAEEPKERVLALGARTAGRPIDWDQALAELERRLAKRSTRSKKPARHAVASLREGEELTPEQCDEAVRVLAEELGCQQGLIMWALHGDTDNQHLHLLILTLDTHGNATTYGPRGQSHEAMQRAIARLEHAFDLQPELGARYEADEHGVRRKAKVEVPAKKRSPIKTEVLQWEAETGLVSFTRFAQDVLAPLLDTAASWEEAQARLAENGTMVLKAGSGGEIRSADKLYSIKLTNVDRRLGWAALTERWGDWSLPAVPDKQYEPRVRDTAAALKWAARDSQRRPARERIQARIDLLRAQKSAEVARLESEYAARRAELSEVLSGNGSMPRVALRSAMRSIYSSRIAEVVAELDLRIAAICAVREDIDDASSLDGLDLDALGSPDFFIEIGWPQVSGDIVEPAGYYAKRVGTAIQYRSQGEPHSLAFVERGNRIWMVDQSDAALAAALIVARARYGDVAAHGDAAFIRRAQQIGQAMGIDVQNGSVPSRRAARQSSPRTAHWRGKILGLREAIISKARENLFVRLMVVQDDHVVLLDSLPETPGGGQIFDGPAEDRGGVLWVGLPLVSSKGPSGRGSQIDQSSAQHTTDFEDAVATEPNGRPPKNRARKRRYVDDVPEL